MVRGCPIPEQIRAIRSSMGFCPQHNILWDELTVLEHLDLFGTIGGMQYAQILAITLFVGLISFPIFGWKSVFFIFLVWPIFEGVLKTMRRMETPCPHCGFDATWYKRDVRVAKKKVEDFWQDKGPPPEVPEEVSIPAE